MKPKPLRCTAGALLSALALTFAVASAADEAPGDVASTAACPPVPQPPTAEQVQAAQREARDHGFLWRISKQGHSSYLFGTLHVGKLAWVFPGPHLRDAIAATDTLALELDITDPELTRSPPPAATAPLALPDSTRARLARQITLACLPEGALQRLHPLMQAVTLTVLSARWEGLDAAFAQEIVLAGAARAQARPIVALESAQAQMALLVPRDADEARRLLDQTLEQLERGRARPLLRRLADAWADGRLGELEDYSTWCECADSDEDQAFMRRLNDDRNAPMAERIDALHGQGKRLLVAVGALHMTGDQGLPRLMAARGYTVQRLVPP
ncbi:MAG TPA: TraB/GumN family protein [Burkholderiaceae bacterium]|nr:TraB/GumN family protein [Burkholderiaceae bacterium]HSB98809.1 TraB/GumN family protein [Burkholderiaceae bacterium]